MAVSEAKSGKSASPRLNVPFVPDDAYISFLNRRRSNIAYCYFSMFSPDVADGRHKLSFIDLAQLTEGLKRIPGPKKYLLLNARFNSPGRYRDGTYLGDLTRRIETLKANGVLHGVVFADAYLLQALSDRAPSLARELEAVPSINLMIDRAEKALALLAWLDDTCFKTASRIPLDRCLNRSPSQAADIAAAVKLVYPHIKIELLANEGCLFNCPFKLTHDSLIALLGMGVHADTLALNRDLGCMRQLNRDPWRVLGSPFLRPEDIQQVGRFTDIIKISGRTLGPAFLTNTIQAYLEGSYQGNLFDLLDACHWMAGRWHLPNHLLGDDFYKNMMDCSHNCGCCHDCANLWRPLAIPKPFALDQQHP